MITYGKTVFWTSTYTRDRLLDNCWEGCNSDFNRYIQKLRRIHQNSIQYLRTVEMHKDGFPHFHAVLRFPIVLTINNGRYFDKKLYHQWKDAWNHGLSDAQPPRPKQSSLAYIIKYTTKDSGRKVWIKYYQHLNVKSVIPPVTPCAKIMAATFSAEPVSRLSQKCAMHKIKQCTWSRNFFKFLLTP